MLRDALVVQEGNNEAVVGGSVMWVRPTETAQEYAWEVVLRRSEGDHWMIWTVREG
jgi:hypothetical protein